jgi:hypothetical protein
MPVSIAHAHRGRSTCLPRCPALSKCRSGVRLDADLQITSAAIMKRLTHSRQDRASRSAINAGVGQETGRPRQVQRAAAPQTVCPFAERRRLTLDASAMCRRQPNRMPFDGNALERPSSALGWEYEPADFYARLRYCPPGSRSWFCLAGVGSKKNAMTARASAGPTRTRSNREDAQN